MAMSSSYVPRADRGLAVGADREAAAAAASASTDHSRSDWDSSEIDGTKNSTAPPAPTYRSASRSDGKSLAGAAGHDQLAAVVVLEAGHDGVDRLGAGAAAATSYRL